MLNLALNARDAMAEGGSITIETANRVVHNDEANAGDDGIGPGRYAVVSVTDDGPGMSGEVAEHAFEPFFTTKEVGKGTGLGLSMVYGFTKQSGGHVELESALGTAPRYECISLHLDKMERSRLSPQLWTPIR